MEAIDYSQALVIEDKINHECAPLEAHNAIATAAPEYHEPPDATPRYIYKKNRALRPDAEGVIVCRLKAFRNDADARCVLFSGDCPAPQNFTQEQVKNFIKI